MSRRVLDGTPAQDPGSTIVQDQPTPYLEALMAVLCLSPESLSKALLHIVIQASVWNSLLPGCPIKSAENLFVPIRVYPHGKMQNIKTLK